MKKINYKGFVPYIAAIILFCIFALLYCLPVLEGKTLQAGDENNWKGVAEEVIKYKSETGETSWWTNSLFSGMPTFQITGSTPSNHITNHILQDIYHLGFDSAIGIIIGYLIGFFIMLLCFGFSPWLAFIGSFVISLSSYFFLIIPAGHYTKACALGYLPAFFGGIHAIFNHKQKLGFAISVITGVISITLHPQMTFYLCMLTGIFIITEILIHIKGKDWKNLLTSIAVFLFIGLLIGGTKLSWFQMNSEYLNETMRGGHSDLIKTSDNENKAETSGLDFDYATAWSYGINETFTLLIPNYMGGASGYNLGTKSNLYKELTNAGISKNSAKQICSSAPTYWGEKAFTSGPVYVGAIICFLFVLGLLIIKSPYKWALLISTIFSITLAWGRNCPSLSHLFFDYFPMYNKFRAVESILVVAEITIPLLALLAIRQLNIDKKNAKCYLKPVFISCGITAGLCLFFALFGSSLLSFTSSYDESWKSQVGEQIYEMIQNQRAIMLSTDAWRSFFLIAFACFFIYLYLKNKLSNKYFTIALFALFLIDMIPVNRRFFNSENFVSKKSNASYFAERDWEKQILTDKDPDFRVLNLTSNTFNDSRTSYRLKSIGGYHAAKLRRYQDLIDAHISQNNINVLNMLNTKYIITKDGIMKNPEAMGNAWFVNEVKYVNTPNEESEALWNINLRTTAVADKQFKDILSTSTEGNGDIHLTKYAPNKLEYFATTENNRVCVFSEIYYPHGWHLYIDDKEQNLGRVNYTLRACLIPAGTHNIRMEFVPKGLTTDKWSMGILIIALLLSAGALGLHFYEKLTKPDL